MPKGRFSRRADKLFDRGSFRRRCLPCSRTRRVSPMRGKSHRALSRAARFSQGPTQHQGHRLDNWIRGQSILAGQRGSRHRYHDAPSGCYHNCEDRYPPEHYGKRAHSFKPRGNGNRWLTLITRYGAVLSTRETRPSHPEDQPAAKRLFWQCMAHSWDGGQTLEGRLEPQAA
jgi:hypothetical protein